MSEYTNAGIYVVVKSADTLPDGVVLPERGEGANKGRLDDGSTWYKNCFMSPEEMRAIVHAEDNGILELKTVEEMRAIKEAQIVEEETLK